MDGSAVTVALEEDMRTRELKWYLATELDIPAAEIELLLGPRILSNSEVLSKLATEQPLALTLLRSSRPRLPAFLEKKGLASVNDRGVGGATVLHLAAAQGDAALCKEVLARSDFDGVDSVDFLGSTALHHAVDRGLREVCTGILAHPSFTAVTAVNRNGRTALHLAALRGDGESCAELLACYAAAGGAPGVAMAVRSSDALGLTAADLAESAGHEVLAAKLRIREGTAL